MEEDRKNKGVRKWRQGARAERSGGQFWNRLSFTKGCTANRRRRRRRSVSRRRRRRRRKRGRRKTQ